ncbi:hypothetical protein CGCF415_v004019 [Colletotrichum fructicola]|uniref:Uncharacterized protein n=1 Tax=Colletotrichum fructicola (strain Nara gc5) TaxID=1213859 RepID=L2G5R5_COLFN|nr:hypothetical protein CGCFRS4_v012136 [Colletotrichum fructicola]KAF4911960.1 hypothetical protein CGCF415_v004019 [Colletotrichum fructicola]KAF4939326.1 hypothetical protein CGCF245_v003601 [Colletotrichum fructicola]
MAEAFKGKGPAPSVPWSDRLHILNTGTQKELDYQRQLLTYKLKEKQVKVQPLKSSGSRFWPDSADIEQMHMDEVALEAHVNFLEAKDKGEVKTLEDWLAKDNNHRWSTKYLAHKQSMEINIAVSKCDNKDQLAFGDHMLMKYCPDRRYKNCCWDPVLADWNRSEIIHTVHLFPHRFRDSMDIIFGPALDDGVLAIVPDIDLEPADLDFPLKDTEERKQRLRDWEKSEVKEYKIIVIDPSHPTLTEEKTLSFSQGIHTLLKLHGRKLRFLTDFRPRARYIWWVFLVSVTVAGWRTKTQNPDVANAIAKEIRAGIRCWGTPGTYITRNVLESFIISIGHDARSFVKGDEDQKKKKKIKPDYCALSLIAHDHAFRNIDEEDDEMDGD